MKLNVSFIKGLSPNFRTSIEDTLELKGYLTVTGQSYIHLPYGISATERTLTTVPYLSICAKCAILVTITDTYI